MLVGYMSFYFDIQSFQDRVMVALTTLLVIATMASSTQAVSRIMLILNFTKNIWLGTTKNLILQIDWLLVLVYHELFDLDNDVSHLHILSFGQVYGTIRRNIFSQSNGIKISNQSKNLCWFWKSCKAKKSNGQNNFPCFGCFLPIDFLVYCNEWVHETCRNLHLNRKKSLKNHTTFQ